MTKASPQPFSAWGHVRLSQRKVLLFPSAIIPTAIMFYFNSLQRMLGAFEVNELKFADFESRKQRLSVAYLDNKDASEAHSPLDNSARYGYHDECRRIAYFLFYVPNHGALLCQAMQYAEPHFHRRVVRSTNKRRPFCVVSFGGGPASDLLGFLMYLERSIPDPSLRPEVAFHVLDLADWQPLWPPVAAAVAEQFPFVQVHFHPVDLTTANAQEVLPPHVDLCLFVNFVVEMVPHAAEFGGFFREALSLLPARCQLVFLEPLVAGQFQAEALMEDLRAMAASDCEVLVNCTEVNRDHKGDLLVPPSEARPFLGPVGMCFGRQGSGFFGVFFQKKIK
eukprot:EG_transcript_8898